MIGYVDHYRGLAAEDLREGVLDAGFVDWQARNVVRYMGGTKGVLGKSVLDVGCGKGHLVSRLYEAGAEVTAVDLAPEYLRAVEKIGLGIRTMECDADNLPFYEDFDAVTATDVMEHTVRPGGFLVSINRALKPGGEFYVRVPWRENLLVYAPQLGCHHAFVHMRTYTLETLRRELAGAGLDVEKCWLDGYSLGTPQQWWGWRAKTMELYERFKVWALSRCESGDGAEVTSWGIWAALFMRPTAIVVRARKVARVAKVGDGRLFELKPCD